MHSNSRIHRRQDGAKAGYEEESNVWEHREHRPLFNVPHMKEESGVPSQFAYVIHSILGLHHSCPFFMLPRIQDRYAPKPKQLIKQPGPLIQSIPLEQTF
jgi:hypothetical protein